jgi:hypothetical protein
MRLAENRLLAGVPGHPVRLKDYTNGEERFQRAGNRVNAVIASEFRFNMKRPDFSS